MTTGAVEQAAQGMNKAHLIIWRSPNGRDKWQIIKPADVPEWVKNHDVMGRLVAGEMAMDAKRDLFWYRAEHTPSAQQVSRIFGNAKRHAKIAERKRRRRAH